MHFIHSLCSKEWVFLLFLVWETATGQNQGNTLKTIWICRDFFGSGTSHCKACVLRAEQSSNSPTPLLLLSERASGRSALMNWPFPPGEPNWTTATETHHILHGVSLQPISLYPVRLCIVHRGTVWTTVGLGIGKWMCQKFSQFLKMFYRNPSLNIPRISVG